MSWLFDRLCEIAVADEIDVVVAVAHDRRDDAPNPRAVEEWADVLARAATVPQLVVTSMPAGAPPTAALGPEVQAIELDELPAGAVVDVVRRTVVEADRRDMAIRVAGGRVAMRPVAPTLSDVRAADGRRLVVATDLADNGALLRAAGHDGLGIAVRGIDPDAQVKVDSFLGVVSIVDALVTLRMFAFGADRVREMRPPVPRLRSA